jgi:hypothetical protein
MNSSASMIRSRVAEILLLHGRAAEWRMPLIFSKLQTVERRFILTGRFAPHPSRISQLRHLSKADINRVTASWSWHPRLYGIQDRAEPRHCVVQKQPHLERQPATPSMNEVDRCRRHFPRLQNRYETTGLDGLRDLVLQQSRDADIANGRIERRFGHVDRKTRVDRHLDRLLVRSLETPSRRRKWRVERNAWQVTKGFRC